MLGLAAGAAGALGPAACARSDDLALAAGAADARPTPTFGSAGGEVAAADADAPVVRAVPVTTPGVRADAVTQAATLRELADAAEQAGDSTLAAGYRRDAAGLAPSAAPPAPARAAPRPPAPRTAERGARRAGSPRSAPRSRARGGAPARPKARPKPRPKARPSAGGSGGRRPGGAPAAGASRAVDRVFSRAERWLGGGSGVRRPFP
jgi:hypothetical protein